MASLNNTVKVAVGVVVREQQFFVCRRFSHQHQGGKWEFPGGKVESDETVPEALKRELKEEIGILTSACEPLLDINFSYPDKTVTLNVMLVTAFEGEAYGAEGQESQWLDFEQLQKLDFPAANVKIIEKLKEIGFQ